MNQNVKQLQSISYTKNLSCLPFCLIICPSAKKTANAENTIDWKTIRTLILPSLPTCLRLWRYRYTSLERVILFWTILSQFLYYFRVCYTFFLVEQYTYVTHSKAIFFSANFKLFRTFRLLSTYLNCVHKLFADVLIIIFCYSGPKQIQQIKDHKNGSSDFVLSTYIDFSFYLETFARMQSINYI